MRIRDWPLAIKIIVFFLITAAGMGVLLYARLAPRVRQTILDGRKVGLMATVDLAAGTLASFVKKGEGGDRGLEEALEETQKEARNAIRNLHYGADGYFFVLSTDGRILVHPDSSLVGKSMLGQKDAAGTPFWDEMIAGAVKDGSGTVSYVWPKPGQTRPLPKITAYRLIPAWGWIVASGIWIDDIDALVDSLEGQVERIALFGGGAVLVLLFLFSFVVTLPMRRFLSSSERILAGDLTVEVTTNRKDEFGRMLHSIGAVVHRLVGIIDRVVPVAVRIDDSIVVLRGAVERTAEGTEKQTDHARQISAASEEMTQTVQDVARTASQSAVLSREAMEAATGGRVSAGQALKGVNQVNAAAGNLSLRFEQLDRSAKEISEVVGMIRSIANQTNLIALNASIEAARAGHAGSRFAVIAEEVRKLARNAGDATGDVSRIVQSVQQEVQAIREAMTAVNENLGQTSEDIGQADESLGAAVRTFNDVHHNISQIAGAIEELAITSREVARNISESMSISTEIDQMARRVKSEFNHLVEVADELRGSTVGIKTKATERIILDLAKTDHRLFVEKIDACLRGESDLQPEGIADHTQCRFGKWYFSEGEKKCGHLPVFKAIDSPHMAVHKLGRQAVTEFRSGNVDGAKETYLKMEDQSQEIISLLEQLKAAYEKEA